MLEKNKTKLLDKVNGTPYFIDPMIVLEKQYSQKSDIFSFGRLVQIVLSGKCLAEVEKENEIINAKIINNGIDNNIDIKSLWKRNVK